MVGCSQGDHTDEAASPVRSLVGRSRVPCTRMFWILGVCKASKTPFLVFNNLNVLGGGSQGYCCKCFSLVFVIFSSNFNIILN